MGPIRPRSPVGCIGAHSERANAARSIAATVSIASGWASRKPSLPTAEIDQEDTAFLSTFWDLRATALIEDGAQERVLREFD